MTPKRYYMADDGDYVQYIVVAANVVCSRHLGSGWQIQRSPPTAPYSGGWSCSPTDSNLDLPHPRQRERGPNIRVNTPI